MSLLSILNLCEEHMNEGDYLIAANTLRNIHNNKSVDDELQRTHTFDSSIKIIKLNKDMEESDSEFIIKAIIQKRTSRYGCWYMEKVKCNIYGNDTILSWSKFHKLLDNYLKMNLYIDFKVDNLCLNIFHVFNFCDYSKFIIQQHDDVCEDLDISEGKWIYSEYIEHAVQIIKNCIEINSDE